LSLCPKDCLYEGYDNKKKLSYCHCNIQKRSNLFSYISQKELIYKISNNQKATNLDILKCYKLIFSKDIFYKNFVNYIFIIIILFYIFSAIYIYKRGYDIICEQINKILEAKNIKLKESQYELNFQLLKKISNERASSSNRNKLIPNNIFTKSDNDLKISSNIIEIKNLEINKPKKEEQKEAEEVMKYTDYEINTISFREAVEKDRRTFFQYYISLLKINNILFFSFNPNKDYNSYLIKICLFLFYLVLNLVINALFFNDSTMHQIYLDKGIFNLKYIFPKLIYSQLISFLIYIFIRKIALTQQDIIDIKNEKNRNKLNAKVIIAIRCIIIKIIVFFICSFMLLLLFWYYISCFCAVYKKTQIYLFKNTLISYLLVFINLFILCLIPGVFRIPSLRKSGECLYKITQITQLF